ncbi:retrovirus-related pol polyprotein from transposon TNT 1-94 [Tanacetum coccineum]
MIQSPTTVKVEVPSELPKVSLVNASLKKLKFHLPQFDSVVKKRTTHDARTKGEWGFEHTKIVFNNEIIPFLKSLKYIFNVFDKDLLNEIMEVQTAFDQMDAVVQQFLVDKQCLGITKKELFLENDRLLQQIMSQDVLLTVMNSMSLFGETMNMDGNRKESCNLEAGLLKSQNAFNDFLKSHSQLEKHCISIECSIQLNQENFQKRESCDNQNALEIPEFFENNDLKAQLQDKDSTICKLKDIIKSMREKSKEENVNYDYCEIETKNVELENSVAKLLLENERLWMFKLDLEPLAPRLLQNREAHLEYLNYTQEQADILQGIVEQAKAEQPLDKELDFAWGSEVAFTEKTLGFIRYLEGLITFGSRDINLYIISLDDMLKTSLIYPKRQRLRAGYGTVGYHISTSEHSWNFMKINVGISHQTSIAHTPQQNDVVERRNRTLVKSARTMLIFSKALLFLWAKAINTACYTQNRSLIRLRYNKTPYELMQDKKPDLSFFHVFGALCYPTNDNDDLGKLDAKADIGIFVGYAPAKKAFRIYNKRTQKIIETIHVTFDELTAMASEQFSSGPGLHSMTPATSSSGLVPNTVSQQPCIPPNRDDWDHLFQPMFDEYFNPPSIVVSPVQEAAAPRAVVLADSLVSTSIDQDAPSTSIPSTQEQEHSPNISQGFEESPKTPTFCDDPLHESLHEDSTSQGSSSNVRQTH